MRCTRTAGLGLTRSAARAAFACACLVGAAAGQGTWYVSSQAACPGSGTLADPFCTIGAGIAAAAPGDTILVAAGEYPENVVIDKDALTLRGAGAAVTSIVGQAGFSVVGPAAGAELPHFTLEGFRITADPALAPSYVYGVLMNPANEVPGSLWELRACLIEGVTVGVVLNDSWYGGAALIENVVVGHCGTGMSIYGENVVIRRCTIHDIEGVGIFSGLPSEMEIRDTIIASIGAWAIQRYWGWPTTVERLLIHDTNLNNPPGMEWAGPFMEWMAEGLPGGLWKEFTPLPGPILDEDPLFVDALAGDVRLTGQSPAVDAGDPATVADPANPYDLLGSGHLRVDDGDFDGLAVMDLGAIEFGGLLANGGLKGALSVGSTLELTQSGHPGALYGILLGLPGTALDLGAKGTFFLESSPLLLLGSGTLPAGGTAAVLVSTLPPAVQGLTLSFQDAQKGPGPGNGLHWTNLERLTILP